MYKMYEKKWMIFTLIFTLMFSLLIPSLGMGAEVNNKSKSVQPSSNIDNLSIPVDKMASSLDHSKKLQMKQKSTVQQNSPFNAKKVDTKNKVDREAIQPKNYVPASDSKEKITVIVELQSQPVAVYQAKIQQGGTQGEDSYQASFTKEQNAFATAAKNKNIKIKKQFKHVFNGYSVTIPANQVDSLLSLPGVNAVYQNIEVKASPVDSITPNMDESSAHIGSGYYWDLGFDGTGIKVGVLDTGIDYNHPSLAPAYKGGYDLVDDDDDPMETLPDPDNPEAATAHGTHVSGTIAGRGDPSDENSPTGWVRGVAPGADLYAYRVLGPGGSGTWEGILAGIERALLDGMDVINLSLGADINDQNDPTAIALNNAMLAGMVAVTSNGNSGPDPYTVGVPASSEMAISVGAASPPLNVPTIHTAGMDPIFASIMSYSPDLSELLGGTYEVEFAGHGLPSDFEGKDFTGKVALISRGSITFKEKSINAKNANAVTTVIYNNVPGNFGGTLGEPGEYIPTISISQEEGLALKDKLDTDSSLSISFDTELEEDYIADFSSRGPALPGFGIKPDISAPGVAIRSAVPAFDGDYEDAYADNQGTSMASPHVAGAAALLLQRDSSLSPFDVKALLLNNALKISDRQGQRYSHMDQGAGRIDLENTLSADAIAFVEETSNAVESGENTTYYTGSIAFGQLIPGASVSRNIVIKDIADTASSYSIDTTWYGQSAGSLVSSDSHVELSSGDSSEFTVTLTVAEDTPDGRYEGEVILTDASGHLLQIPVAVYVGEVELPDIISDISITPNIFSPNTDGVEDFTDIEFKANRATDYFSMDVYNASTGEWIGYITEDEEGVEPGTYSIEDWNGVVSDYENEISLEDGYYYISPWVSNGTGIMPVEDQYAVFIADVNAPVSSLNEPAITVSDEVGTIAGQIESDFMVDFFEDYSAINVAALYDDNGWKQVDGTIANDGSFTIQVPVTQGENEYEIYVYDAALNGVIEPAHIVQYTHQETPQTGISVVPSSTEVTTGEAFNIAVNFSELADVYAAQFSLTYDANITKGSITPSEELAAYQEAQNPGTSLIVDERVVPLDNGMVRSDYIISLAGDFEGYTGAGSLATFNFSSGTSGTFSFDISEVRLLNSQGEEINYGSVNNTSVTVTQGTQPPNDHVISGNIQAEAFGPDVDYSLIWYDATDGTHRVVVEALNTEGSIVGVGTVAEDGSYQIQVPTGEYTVRVVVPSHIGQSTSFTVSGNVTQNFGPLTAGDVNGEGIVDLIDLQLVAKSFAKATVDGQWADAIASAADINRDSEIDLLDISFVLNNFGATE